MKALITGASSGLGKVFAEELAKQGYSLVLVARRQSNLQEIKKNLEEKYHVSIEYIAQDLSTAQGVERVFAEAQDIDLLVNNAGYGLIGDCLDLPTERELGMLDLNIKSLYLLSKKYAVLMAAKKAGGIINVASTASFQPTPYMAVYGASKSFVLHFTEALSKELEPSGVRIMALCPGPTKTEFFRVAGVVNEAKILKTPYMLPEKVVKKCLIDFKNGKRISTPGFFNAFISSTVGYFSRNFVLDIAYKMFKKT